MNTVLTRDVAYRLSREFVALLFDKLGAEISSGEWAAIFARSIGAVCLDSPAIWNVARENEIAWCARAMKIWFPHQVRHVELTFSGFDIENVHTEDPAKLGKMILGIWNARITDVRKKFATTRTVVLIKGEDLSTVSVFEEEALKFLPEEYEWDWNESGNLEGYVKGTNDKKFTWQPHGSQFTVTTTVPKNRLKLRIRRPPLLDRDGVLAQLKFDPSWIEIVR